MTDGFNSGRVPDAAATSDSELTETASSASETPNASAAPGRQEGETSGQTPASVNLAVTGAQNSRIILAAGPISMYGRQPLTVTAISEAELRVVRQAWVSRGPGDEPITTISETMALFAQGGSAVAVIAGPSGFGKRTAAIRTLSQISRARAADGKHLALKEVRPDWEDPAAPDTSLLPDAPDTGYLLDVAAEMAQWKTPDATATALLKHAENLAGIGSYLVVVADDRSWPENASGSVGRVLGTCEGQAVRPRGSTSPSGIRAWQAGPNCLAFRTGRRHRHRTGSTPADR